MLTVSMADSLGGTDAHADKTAAAMSANHRLRVGKGVDGMAGATSDYIEATRRPP